MHLYNGEWIDGAIVRTMVNVTLGSWMHDGLMVGARGLVEATVAPIAMPWW